MSTEKKYILDKAAAASKLERMALEVLEQNMNASELILAGIRNSGSIVAKNVQALLAKHSSIPTRIITITLDKKHPAEVNLSEDIQYKDQVIIVIDDVANSGKTMLYAIQPFLAFHPKKIQTFVLVERTHKAFPISSDFVGLSVATTLQEHIYVEVNDEEVLGAYLA